MTRYPLYRKLRDRSGRAQKFSPPTGIRSACEQRLAMLIFCGCVVELTYTCWKTFVLGHSTLSSIIEGFNSAWVKTKWTQTWLLTPRPTKRSSRNVIERLVVYIFEGFSAARGNKLSAKRLFALFSQRFDVVNTCRTYHNFVLYRTQSNLQMP